MASGHWASSAGGDADDGSGLTQIDPQNPALTSLGGVFHGLSTRRSGDGLCHLPVRFLNDAEMDRLWNDMVSRLKTHLFAGFDLHREPRTLGILTLQLTFLLDFHQLQQLHQLK